MLKRAAGTGEASVPRFQVPLLLLVPQVEMPSIPSLYGVR